MGRVFDCLIVLLTCRAIFSGVSAGESLECKELVSKSVLLRLKRHLFCEYDATVRPILNTNSTINVTIHVMPKFMDFDDHTNLFTLHSWVSFTWMDEHLKWNPGDFEEVTDIRVKSDELWEPDFSVYNSGDMELDQKGIPSTDCILESSGFIFCVPAMKFTTQCIGNYELWPYDKQNCTIRFGSWTHTGEEINFLLSKEAISTEHFSPHVLWSVKRMNLTRQVTKFECCPNDTFPVLILEVNLERHSRMTQSIFVTPAVVLMLITLTTMWLDSRSYERIALAGVNFMCHLIVIFDMHWIVPSNGENLPHMVIFYRNSLLLASFAMISTTLLRKLQAVDKLAPNWMSSAVSVVLSYRASQFLLIHGNESRILLESSPDNAGDNAESSPIVKEISDWRRLAIIIERLSFVCVIFIYVVMLIILIPVENDFQPTKAPGPW